MPTPTATTRPPSYDQVVDALRMLRLPADEQPAAAVHLATATDVAVGMAATVQPGDDGPCWQLRGIVAVETADPARFAVTLANAVHRPDDRYLDLTGDPARWVKTMRSGAAQIVFGSQLLFHLPVIHADVTLPVGDLYEVVRQLSTDPTFQPPAISTGRAGSLLISGTAARLQVQVGEPYRS